LKEHQVDKQKHQTPAGMPAPPGSGVQPLCFSKTSRS
jgi:hypothetical protein